MFKSHILCVLFLISVVGYSQPDSKIKMWATDLTGTLSGSELELLNNKLKSYEDTTSNQIVVLIINSLEGYPIEEVSHKIASINKIGTEKNNNGILFLIAKDDKQMRFEVGYGLEGVVPDAIASSIIRNVVRPKFREGDYYGGINSGIDEIIKAIGGEYKADENSSEDEFPFYIFIIIILIILFFTRFSGPFIPGGIYRTGTGRSGWSGGSGSWGGSSSWGGGGFSGGGGSFGGGGASGSW